MSDPGIVFRCGQHLLSGDQENLTVTSSNHAGLEPFDSGKGGGLTKGPGRVYLGNDAAVSAAVLPDDVNGAGQDDSNRIYTPALPKYDFIFDVWLGGHLQAFHQTGQLIFRNAGKKRTRA